MTDNATESKPHKPSVWITGPLNDRLTKITNFEAYAGSCAVFEEDENRHQASRITSSRSMADIRAAVTRSVLSVQPSSLSSSPTSSPIVRRKPDATVANCKPQIVGKNWLFPLIRREGGEARLSVTNFDINAISPTSW